MVELVDVAAAAVAELLAMSAVVCSCAMSSLCAVLGAPSCASSPTYLACVRHASVCDVSRVDSA